jgi:transcriptional regulator with XRE-family HTH domain
MAFAELIQKLREQAGLSQSQLAKRAGVPVRSIQNWEQGHRQPRPPALLPLAEALGVPVEKLIKSMSSTGEGKGKTAEAPKKKTRKRKGK